jgi:acyl carrier protein
LPALGSRFNFTETVLSPDLPDLGAKTAVSTKALMSETIQARVLRVIATTQRIPLEKVKPDSTFEELGIDSMDSINILFDLESEFDIEIKDEDAKKIQTIREMIDGVTYLVDSKVNPTPQAATE